MACMRALGFGTLLVAGLMASAAPAFAGFEFSGSSAAPALQQQASAYKQEAPMPIVAAIPVTSEPLAPPQRDAVLSNQVSRQQTITTLSPARNEAIDTQGLLEATTRGRAVSVAPTQPSGASTSGRLVINPYPLNATPSMQNGMPTLPVEQAMMEQTGALRPIGLPGQQSSGMIARAKISERHDTQTPYLQRDDSAADPYANDSMLAMSITPIPGGEGAPLSGSTSQQLAYPANAYPVPAPVQPMVPRAPIMTSSYGSGYTEAVGFGRDLPLALALSQVIPPEYSYSFGQNIDAGANVSWEGGKPWNVVLDEMLAPSGMKAVIESNQVSIRNLQS